MTSDRVATGDNPCYSYVMVRFQEAAACPREREAAPDVATTRASCPKAPTRLRQKVGKEGGTCLPTDEHEKELPIPCREATDIEPGEAVVGFPGAMVPALAADIERLAERAVPRSRAKRPYAALAGADESESPFGGDACT